jgi:hypothetical protein
MARVSVPTWVPTDRSGGHVQKLINTTVSTWHAVIAGGSAVNETSGFTNPDPDEADRIPELALAVGGTPGIYTITGTWNGDEQSDSILTVANATAKGSVPFDTITSLVGPDPVQNLTLNKGDSYFDPPVRWVYTGDTGPANCAVRLVGESAVKLVSALPAGLDWARRAVRVGASNSGTTLTNAYGVW